MSTHGSAILITVALLLIPAAIWAEQTNLKVWQNELVAPITTPEPNRHTPQFTDGAILPPVINKDLTLSPTDNPVILAFNTIVSNGTTLTILPGTNIFTHEFTTLTIAGQLDIVGTNTQPVTISSNEVHPLNQTWGGIIVTAPGQADISYLTSSQGSPAISCLPGSQVAVTNSELSAQLVGVFASSDNCTFTDSRIRSTRDGIIAIGSEPQLFNTSINAHVRSLQVVPN